MRNHNLCEQNYLVFGPTVSDDLRSELLESTDLTCRMCGIGAGQFDSATGFRALLHIELGPDTSAARTGLIVTCSICVDGRREMHEAQTCAHPLLEQICRADMEEQLAIYDWLKTKFKE